MNPTTIQNVPLRPPAAGLVQENILRAFNNQVDLRAGYGWTRAQVFAFLDHVVIQPATYGVAPSVVGDLVVIRNEIRQLSLPNGNDYRAAGLEPDQHIYRLLRPEWTGQSLAISKFSVRKHYHNNVPYWNNFDLLGLFLALIGPASANATKKNFYLPLTAMYARWCMQIGNHSPYMTCCTWSVAPNRRDKFFLGANLSGSSFSPAETGIWRRICQMARFGLINSDALRLRGWFFNDSLMIRERGSSNPIRFGNCAETYPYLHILR